MPLSQDGVRRERAADFAANVWMIDTVAEVIYAPGQPPVFDMLGRRWANWFDPGPSPRPRPATARRSGWSSST